LAQRSRVNSSGLNPAYVSWDTRGDFALVANYGQGDDSSTGSSITVFPVNRSSGTIGNVTYVVRNTGNGTNPDRQAGSHPHMVTVDYSGQFVFSPDLGLDKIFQYQLLANGTLRNNTQPYAVPDQAGSGPRHMAFHPSHRFAYVINELLSTINVYLYDTVSGQMGTVLQSVSTLPPGWVGNNTAAEIVVAPDGRVLYGSNRGHESIVGFYIDTQSTDFHLKAFSWTTYHISTPRNFAIDPSGRLMLVGASNTSEIVAFNILQDGSLQQTGAIHNMSGAISIVLSESN